MAPVEEPGRWRGRIRQRCGSLRIRWFAGENPVDQRDKTCGAPGAWRHHTPGAVADWGNGLVKANTTPRGCGSSCAASDRIPGRSSARSKNVTATAVPSFARLERSGALRRVAPGYYAVVPDDRVGLVWLPELEAVALRVGVALAGVALMGLSAARVHGGLPRASGVAVVAMARHRPVLRLTDRDAVVLFVRRGLAGLDLQRH